MKIQANLNSIPGNVSGWLKRNIDLRDIRTVFLRELKVYFNSPIAYIVIIAFLVIAAWFFVSHVFINGEATINDFLDIVPFLFVFFIPAVAMRLLSEEYKSGTIEVLTTLPVRTSDIVIAKFLSALALISIMILLTAIHPFTLLFLGRLDIGQVVCSYLGMILLGAAFLSIGLFASSLTSNQIIAFIVGLVICFAFFMLGKVTPVVPSGLVTVFEYAGTDSHFASITRGVIDSRDLVYYFSIIGFFYLLSLYFVNKFKFSLYSGATLTTVLGILIVINYFSFYFFGRLDLSEGKVYSLSKASRELVAGLDDELVVKAYFNRGLPSQYADIRSYLEDLLNEYRVYSRGKMKFEFLDPGADERISREAVAMGIYPVSLTQIARDKYELQKTFMGAVFLYADKRETMPFIQNTTGLEYDISSRIRKVTRAAEKKVGFLTGHQEIDPTLDFGQVFDRLSRICETRSVNLSEGSPVPDDIDALMVIGPKQRLTEREIYSIDQFLMKGKPVAFFIDRYDINMQSFMTRPIDTGMDGILSFYGIGLEKGLIFDPRCQRIMLTQNQGPFMFQQPVDYPLLPRVTDFKKDNVLVKSQNVLTLPFVSPLEPGQDSEVLAMSSDESWLNENPYFVSPVPSQPYQPGPSSKKGPFVLAAICQKKFASFYANRPVPPLEKKEPQGEKKKPSKPLNEILPETIREGQPSRILVVGTSKMVDPKLSGNDSPNMNFFLNTIDWLSQDEKLISIRSKGAVFRPLKPVPDAVRLAVKWINFLLMPAVLVVFGVMRWRRRKSAVVEI